MVVAIFAIIWCCWQGQQFYGWDVRFSMHERWVATWQSTSLLIATYISILIVGWKSGKKK